MLCGLYIQLSFRYVSVTTVLISFDGTRPVQTVLNISIERESHQFNIFCVYVHKTTNLLREKIQHIHSHFNVFRNKSTKLFQSTPHKYNVIK